MPLKEKAQYQLFLDGPRQLKTHFKPTVLSGYRGLHLVFLAAFQFLIGGAGVNLYILYLFVPTDTTVDPTVVSQELVDLKSGTLYMVQLWAFTSAGAGVTSDTSYFETRSQGTNAKHYHQSNKRFTTNVLAWIFMCVKKARTRCPDSPQNL